MSDQAGNIDDIRFEVRGRIGHILLNRPKALNALTLEMCQHLLPTLQAWEKDNQVKAVVIRGAGDKAFCVGGDVIRLYEDGRAGGLYPRDFYRTEYRCNTFIKRFTKPYVSLIDGIVMGGGLGRVEEGREPAQAASAHPQVGIGQHPGGLDLAARGIVGLAGLDAVGTLALPAALIGRADPAQAQEPHGRSELGEVGAGTRQGAEAEGRR